MAIRTVVVLTFLSVAPSLVLGEGAEGTPDIAPFLVDRQGFPPADPSTAATPTLSLSLVFFDPARVLPIPEEDLATEVKALFQALGVEVTWRNGAEAPTTTARDLQVILLPSDRSGGRLDAGTMGAVRRTSDDSPHALWVFLPAVQKAIGISPLVGAILSTPDQLSLTTALGRVIAHETVHAVAPDQPHTRGGLMKGRIGRQELLYRHVQLEGASRRAFLAGLTTWTEGRPSRKPTADETVALRVR